MKTACVLQGSGYNRRGFVLWAAVLWISTSAYLWTGSENWVEGLGSPLTAGISLPPVLIASALLYLALFHVQRRWIVGFVVSFVPVAYWLAWVATVSALIRVVNTGNAGSAIGYLSDMSIFLLSKVGTITLVLLFFIAMLFLWVLARRRLDRA